MIEGIIAGFDQKSAAFGIPRQPGRPHALRRTADDDDVKLHGRHSRPSPGQSHVNSLVDIMFVALYL
jgi:hypothetical protein